tara:strand:+ start:6364 stop:6615 length:252 start_codon:yes stop_codon:yes gene_type:complete
MKPTCQSDALRQLGEQIRSRLKPGMTFTIRHPVEIQLLAPLSAARLREFADYHGLHAVRNSDGRQIHFTPKAWPVFLELGQAA